MSGGTGEQGAFTGPESLPDTLTAQAIAMMCEADPSFEEMNDTAFCSLQKRLQIRFSKTLRDSGITLFGRKP